MTYDLSETKEILDQSFMRLKDLYLTTSVLSLVRTYAPRNNVDMEFWTFFCAIVDFQVPVITWLIPMLKGLRMEIEGKGKKFIDLVENPDDARKVLLTFKWGNGKSGFSHRFIRINDLLDLFGAMNDILPDYSSMGDQVRSLYEDGIRKGAEEPIGFVIKQLASEIRKKSPELVERNKVIIPNPAGNSAMKRMCLFFRWMVRPYPDLGVWNFIELRHLLVSLDLGVMRTAKRAFGIHDPDPAT